MAVEIFDRRVANNPPAMYLDSADILNPYGESVLVLVDVEEHKITLRPVEFARIEAKDLPYPRCHRINTAL